MYYKNSKHKGRSKELEVSTQYSHHLDSIIVNSFLYLPYHLTHLSIHHSIHTIFDTFQSKLQISEHVTPKPFDMHIN